MTHRYFLILAINTTLIVMILFPSCSKNDEDIAAPVISIIQPAANDTVQITNGYITIKVVASDNVDIIDMEMSIKDESGTVLFDYDLDNLEERSYTCIENFHPEHINQVTKLKLNVTFQNEYKNWESKSIDFFVKP
jgi:hypothetical protein